MRKLLQGALLALVASLCVLPARAQDVHNFWQCALTGFTQWCSVSATNPLPVTASVSASITGFPGAAPTTGTPISVTTGGVTGTLPAGAVVVGFNVGATNTAYCKLGASSTTSDTAIQPGSWFAFTVALATQLTCITSTSTTTVNMVGGSGLPTGSGGGGGGSGGGAVTVADGADVTQGAIADAAATQGSTGTVSAKLRTVTSQLNTGNGSLSTIATNTTQAAQGSSIAGMTAAVIMGQNTAGNTTIPVIDPCQALAKTYTPINISASGSAKIITGTASKRTYICHIDIVTASANNVLLLSGTGSNCGTGATGIAGGTTAASGWNFAANGGIALGQGISAVLASAAGSNLGDDICLNPSASTQLSGTIATVQAP